jgi:serpin B
MKHLSQILFLMFLFLLASCDSEMPNEQDPKVDAQEIQDVAEAHLDFSWDLFKTSCAQEDESKNVLVSPLSVHTALNMALNGAQGQTLDQMESLLHTSSFDLSRLNLIQADWLDLLQKSGHPELTIANALFSDPSRVDLQSAFTSILEQHYLAQNNSYDFSDPDTKTAINQWVSDQTGGKIKGIIDQITADDIAFLINALYFKADWAKGFNPEFTQERTFVLRNGTAVATDFVMADRNFTFIQEASYEGVDIPFKDSTYSLTLLQPHPNVGTASDWIQDLNSDFLRACYDKMQYGRAMVQFPIMDLEYKRNLKDDLRLLGMEDAFSKGKADFSKLGNPLSGPNIFMSTVAHKTALKIDEKGAEGAAATSIGFSTTSAPPSFIFDHSFILILRHIETNSIVFMGKVENPLES